MKKYTSALEERIWCVNNLSEIFKRNCELAYELFIYGEGSVADVLVRTERLMFKQFEYEETAVLSGKQLCYSEYFKVYIEFDYSFTFFYLLLICTFF